MDSLMYTQMDSQVEEDCASQYANNRPYSMYSTSPQAMPYAMPPHGYTALLTSPNPSPSGMCNPSSFVPYSQNSAKGLTEAPPSPPAMQTPSIAHSKIRKPLAKRVQAPRENRGQSAKKAKSSKEQSQKVDLEDDEGRQSVLWKDYWVDQLVHIRGGMNEEFNKPQKQGVDLWRKVSSRLVSLYPDFDKDSESCRKKWARVYAQYKVDKAHNAVSGNDRKVTCKWFDTVDEYMHDRAHVVCVSHASSLGDGTSVEAMEENTNAGVEHTTKSNVIHGVVRGKQVLDASLEKMADTGEKLLEHLKAAAMRREALESRRLDLFEAMSHKMASFFDFAKKD